MKRLLIPFLAIAVLASCGGEETEEITEQSGNVQSSVSSDGDFSPEEVKKMEEAYEAEKAVREARLAGITTMSFSQEVYDFGDVQADTDNFLDVTVTNTGTKPLNISEVKASCGCTSPKTPEGPIAPGESDIIQVKFHSKAGQKDVITKTVTVFANVEGESQTFDIKANVKL